MATTEEDLKQRTKQFSLRVIRLVRGFPNTSVASVIGRQLLRSGTSFGANYRAACRAKSPADMIAKLSIVEEEADEAGYWLELIVESKLMTQTRLTDLIQEADELTAIMVASIRTLCSQSYASKSKIQNPKSKI